MPLQMPDDERKTDFEVKRRSVMEMVPVSIVVVARALSNVRWFCVQTFTSDCRSSFKTAIKLLNGFERAHESHLIITLTANEFVFTSQLQYLRLNAYRPDTKNETKRNFRWFFFFFFFLHLDARCFLFPRTQWENATVGYCYRLTFCHLLLPAKSIGGDVGQHRKFARHIQSNLIASRYSVG